MTRRKGYYAVNLQKDWVAVYSEAVACVWGIVCDIMSLVGMTSCEGDDHHYGRRRTRKSKSVHLRAV